MRKLSFDELLRRMSTEWKYGIDLNDVEFIRRRIAASHVERDLRELLEAIQDQDLGAIIRAKGRSGILEMEADDVEEAGQLLARRFDRVWRFWTKLRHDLKVRGKKRR